MLCGEAFSIRWSKETHVRKSIMYKDTVYFKFHDDSNLSSDRRHKYSFGEIT